jgi:mannosyl-oligosaccharide glucosidase
LAPFNTPEYVEFSKSMLSNLVGGIGYFYGGGLVDRTGAPEYEEQDEGFWEDTAEARARATPFPEEERELFTCIPSRPFFPRGFLWDEGFHLIPVIDWDIDLTYVFSGSNCCHTLIAGRLDIVKSWLNLMDDDGWIAREQILGLEARSKVPPDFTVQYPHYANPPTLFLILEVFVNKLNSQATPGGEWHQQDLGENIRSVHLQNRELAIAYLRSVYPLLKRHYFWFKDTQWGDVKSYDRTAFSTKEAYRWRGRNVQHILTSGLDDYPRPQPPHPGELHVDLISWMGMATRSMRGIAETLGEKEDVEEFEAYETAIARNIDDLHWDDKAQTYCDATVDDYEESVHNCHSGYISISPFLTGMVGPESPRLKPILDLISNRDELWSDYGIRSLSKGDELYGTGENYWRSPIWININYLVLKNLYVSLSTSVLLGIVNLTVHFQDIVTAPGPHRDQARKMYSDLRKNLVSNVFNEWKKTGFAWEQYNPETGGGQRTQHFTGWTSLVVKMMVMPDLPVGKGSHHDEL